MVVDVVWLVDDRQVASVHVDLPNIDDNMNEDNGNFDKINQHSMDKMHMVHFLVKMDQYQAKYTHASFYTFVEQSVNLLIYENNHILYQSHQLLQLAYNYVNHKTTLCQFLKTLFE